MTGTGKHLFLTGFMGAGKTTVGRVLANGLGWPFVDLDTEIEKQQEMEITEIFESGGERHFRDLESVALRSVPDSPPAVVATGGGILTVAENRAWIRAHGRSIWLDAPFEVVARRIGHAETQGRPLFETDAQARALFEIRRLHYSDADVRIEVSSRHSVAEVTAMIRHELEERRCDT